MKKRVLAALVASMMLLTTACGSSNEKVITKDNTTASTTAVTENTQTTSTADVQKGYVFKVSGVSISIDQDMSAVLSSLGEPASYFEAASCAFEGLDKIYTYNDFEIDTYPNGNQDFISTIILLDDVVTTAEGIYIGCDKQKVLDTYGADYTEEGTMIVYKKDGMKLCFLMEGETVSSIQYFSTVLD